MGDLAGKLFAILPLYQKITSHLRGIGCILPPLFSFPSASDEVVLSRIFRMLQPFIRATNPQRCVIKQWKQFYGLN
jgi:hypothetical protein